MPPVFGQSFIGNRAPVQSSISSGGGDGLTPGSASSDSQNTASNRQFFSNPKLVDAVSNQLAGVTSGSSQFFNDFIQNPAQSPIFQGTLQTLLNNLRPGEAELRQNTQDQFRQAGALNSGAFSNAVINDNRNIGAQRASTATDLLGKTFGTTLQGLLGGIGQGNPLIQGLKLSEGSSQGTTKQRSEGNPGGSGGGQTASVGFAGNPLAFQSNGDPGGAGFRGTLSTPNPTFTAPTLITPDLSNFNFSSVPQFF